MGLVHPFLTSFLLTLVVNRLQPVIGELEDVIKTCHDVSCDPRTDDVQPHPDYRYKMMTAGVPQILWDSVRSGSLFKQSNSVSEVCASQLLSISEAMSRDQSWPYHFIDSSGKTPAGLFRSTITAIGDYDQCLRISRGDVAGKYCMIDMFPIVTRNQSKERLDLSRASVFRGYQLWTALCLPSGCGEVEIQKSLHELMSGYGIRVNGDISCDTAHDVSIVTRLLNLTGKQIVSLIFVLSTVGVVLACTAHQALNFLRHHLEDEMPPMVRELPVVPQPELLKSLSLFESSKKLFYSKPTEYEVFVFDMVKLFVIWTGTMAHLLVNVESPLSTATMDKHDVLNYLLSSPETQYLMNDAGLVIAAFLSGAAVFVIAFPAAQQGKLPYTFAIVDRFIRFLPAMASLTALEFIWPLIGSGPFYKRIDDFNLQKCDRNWWLNLLFINNYFIDGIDICGGHSFYSSVDMQLFVIGMLGIYLFAKSEKTGVLFCIAMMLFGSVKMGRNAMMHQTTGTLYTPFPSAQNISEYFSHVTVHVATYLPAYFAGFLVAFGHSRNMFPNKVDGWVGHFKWFLAWEASQLALHFVAILYNSLQLIPPSWAFLVVVLTRSFQTITISILFVYFMTFKSAWTEAQRKGQQEREKENQAEEKASGQRTGSGGSESFSLLKAMCRLSFSVYMSNYLYIRTEFFTRRFLQHNHLFWIGHRLLSSMFLVYVTAILFHLFFLAPFESLRVHIMRSLRSRPKAEKSD